LKGRVVVIFYKHESLSENFNMPLAPTLCFLALEETWRLSRCFIYFLVLFSRVKFHLKDITSITNLPDIKKWQKVQTVQRGAKNFDVPFAPTLYLLALEENTRLSSC
jgi:hypothetical protein